MLMAPRKLLEELVALDRGGRGTGHGGRAPLAEVPDGKTASHVLGVLAHLLNSAGPP